MKTSSIIFSLILIITVLALTVNAKESSMMPGNPGNPDDLSDNIVHHRSNFKVTDLDFDDVPEIIFLENETLIVMDNQGEVIFTKEVEGIEDNHDGDHHHDFDNPDEDVIKSQHMGRFPISDSGHFNGVISLDVADIDMDQIPEIIILDSEKLIILDNNGDQKLTIPIPEVESE